MNPIKILNPQSNWGQIIFSIILVLGVLFFYIKYVQPKCPPSTTQQIEVKANSKKDGRVILDLNNSIDRTDSLYSIDDLRSAGIPERHIKKLGFEH